MITLCDFHCFFFLDNFGYPWKNLVLIPWNIAPSREKIYETTRKNYTAPWNLAEYPTRENTTHGHEINTIYYSWKHSLWKLSISNLWKLNFNPWKISKSTGENFGLPFYCLEWEKVAVFFFYPWWTFAWKKNTHCIFFFLPILEKKNTHNFGIWLIDWATNFFAIKKNDTFG